MATERRYPEQFAIVISPKMDAAIKEFCKEHKVSKAEVGRRALDLMFPEAARGYEDH